MGIRNELAAYCLDGAVVTLGTVIENALLERIEVGMGDAKKSIARYTLPELLADGFTLPRPGGDSDGGDLSLLKGAGFYDEVS